MARYTIFYFVSFILLILLNVQLSLFLYTHYNKEAKIKLILDEIASATNPVDQFSLSSAPHEFNAYKAETKLVDGRAANLKSFFRKNGSPLYDYAELMVEESDKYRFDYRLLAAIAMQESTLCKFIPSNSHNCWGWGIYGNTVTRFSSYEEGIKTVAKGIDEEYIGKGLLTASAIMSKYTPASPNGSWAKSVNYFLRILE